MATDDDDDDPSLVGHGLAIREASELLGVPAPSMRSWERRYGLPTTARTVGGHRRYDAAALNQIRMMRDEISTGHPAAKAARRVLGLIDTGKPMRSRVDDLMAGSQAMDAATIRGVLMLAETELGLAATLDEVLMPALRQIGAWWETGRCDIGQEHFTTEVIRGWLAKTITLSPPPASEWWVLLAVGPQDQHTLGIEALAALLRHHAIGCRVLGARPTQLVVVSAAAAGPTAAVVVVSHLTTQRRPAVETIEAVAATGCPTFYAGAAFLFPAGRRGSPGSYLGETIGGAGDVIRAALAAG